MMSGQLTAECGLHLGDGRVQRHQALVRVVLALKLLLNITITV
jgi:hypothetical protein